MLRIVVYDLEKRGLRTIKASSMIFNCDDLTYEAYDRDGEIVYKGKVDCIGTISEAKEKKDCSTCKYECNKDEYRPCSLCDNHDKWEKWEAKDNG